MSFRCEWVSGDFCNCIKLRAGRRRAVSVAAVGLYVILASKARQKSSDRVSLSFATGECDGDSGPAFELVRAGWVVVMGSYGREELVIQPVEGLGDSAGGTPA